MGQPSVLILGGRPEGWHGLRLRTALSGLGARVSRLDLRAIGLAVGDGVGVQIRGIDEPPDAVVVRSVPAGSFEEVTLRLGLLYALETMGVAVVNHARAIERCVDKSMTSYLLAREGLPTPPTMVTQSADEARGYSAAEAADGHQTVLKPLFGAQGRGLRLLAGPDDVPAAEEVGGVYYLQRFVGPVDRGWCDFRVFVVGGRAIAAMSRRGSGWVTNIGQGGRPEPVRAGGRLAELAVAAVAAVGAAHAGVDLLLGPGGDYQILEVNSMPAWQGLQCVTDADIALHLARDVLARIAVSGPAAD